MFGLEIFIRVK